MEIKFAEQWQFENQLDSQTCTTEEQSQRLLDLGLKIETADMKGFDFTSVTTSIDCTEYEHLTAYPAWSLHRLICLCDTNITISKDKLKDVYEQQISILETLIKTNQFNTDYLINKL